MDGIIKDESLSKTNMFIKACAAIIKHKPKMLINIFIIILIKNWIKSFVCVF